MPYVPEGPKRKVVRKATKHRKSKWKKASKAFKAKHIWCEVWLWLGRHVPAEDTDHIIRAEDGGAFYDEANWMPMSKFWHSKKTNMEQAGLKLKSYSTPSGLLPVDREEIIRILLNKFDKDIKEWQEGQRS